MNYPYGVAVNSAGTIVYFSDSGNSRIRKVTGGTITLFAGRGYLQPDGTSGYSGDGGAATAATLNHPFGVALDTAGNVFIADTCNNIVRDVGTNGLINTVAGIAPAANVATTCAAARSAGGLHRGGPGDFREAERALFRRHRFGWQSSHLRLLQLSHPQGNLWNHLDSRG